MLRKVFASFFIACLIFSASVLPCLANTTAYPDYIMEVTAGFAANDLSKDGYFYAGIPSSGRWRLYSNSSVTYSAQPMRVASGLYAPADHDRTLFISLGFQTDTASEDSWFNGVNDYVNKPDLVWADSRDDGETDSGTYTLVDGVEAANDIYGITGAAGEIFNFQVTIPAYSNMFTFHTNGFVNFTVADVPWHCVTYGGYIIDTADSSLLGVVEQILDNTASIDANVANMVTAINDILAQLRTIGADTATMVEILTNLEDLNDRQLSQLELIANNTEAIYFFLTEALKTESDEMKQAASDATSKIENNSSAEAYYQASMQGSYDKLDLENFDLTFMDSSLELIATIFGDMWLAFGQWKIVFTFPLFLGVALLVIGRISRTGGGNSSRNSEHKGGEGGA